MKTKNLLVILLIVLFTTTSTFAKKGFDVELEQSQKPYKANSKNGNIFNYIIGETSDYYVAYRTTLTGIIIGFIPIITYDVKIAIYDKSTLDFVEAFSIFPKDYIVKGKFKPTGIYGFFPGEDGKFHMLFDYKSQKEDNTTLYAQTLTEEGELDGEENKLQVGKFRKGMAGNFNVKYSSDSSMFLAVYEIPTKNKENQEYEFYVYNKNLEIIHEKKIELPFQDKNVNLIGYDIDKDGNIFGLVKIYEKQEKGSTKKPDNYKYQIYSLYKEDEEFTVFDFDINYYINSMTFKVRNGEIYCTGFFGKKNAGDISGVYTVKINAETGEELVQDTYEFSDEFIEEFYTEKQVAKADKKGKELEVPEIVLDHFVINRDGSAYLIGEQFYTYTVCYSTGNGGQRCVTYYVHNDIIVSSIDPTGDIQWSVKIPKKSRAAGGTYHLSYAFIQKGEDLYFVYNDSQKNFKNKDPKKVVGVPGFNKELDLVCTKVNMEGEKEKTLIYNYGMSANQLKTFPNNMAIFGGEFIGQGMVKGRKEVLVKLIVKED